MIHINAKKQKTLIEMKNIVEEFGVNLGGGFIRKMFWHGRKQAVV